MIAIDAHQHFWRYDAQEYGWIGPDMAVLKKDYLPEDLRPLQQEVGIAGTVAVQARQTLAETYWLLQHHLFWLKLRLRSQNFPRITPIPSILTPGYHTSFLKMWM